ncbi:MOSC domain-containing protein [Brachybacterium sp. Z12]|uniref:MOSC domain-containing protein n=1 Tax=Brachybacterium sp. Z12 TaxID=2759167 RepID=UPI00223B70BC|nr:MOSC domain-containing protein [Brachybacterium sp. Z12]
MSTGTGRIAAVCTVAQLFPVAASGLMSGIDKRPVDGPVRLLPHGVLGDVQGDREHHGGIFKAVYAFARETREALAAAHGLDLPDGSFGENLVTTGQDTDETVIGERWRIGTAELEATAVRNPCGTFAAWIGDRRWGRHFTAAGRAGAYFRVLVEGRPPPATRSRCCTDPSTASPSGTPSAGWTRSRPATCSTGLR